MSEITGLALPLSVVGDESKPRVPLNGFGRVRMPNPGSRAFGFAENVKRSRATATYKTKVWQMGRGLWYQSQGQTSECVRYGITHMLMLLGISRANAFKLTEFLYKWAQRNDPWPGEEPSYYGTAVDTGLQFALHYREIMLKEFSITVANNLFDSYYWCRNMDDALTRLTLPASQGGGVLVSGSDFYENMDGDGSYNRGDPRRLAEPSGDLWGGHCMVVVGTLQPTAKRSRRMIFGNSHHGNYEFEMDADAFEWLMFAQGGELAAPVEHPLR